MTIMHYLVQFRCYKVLKIIKILYTVTIFLEKFEQLGNRIKIANFQRKLEPKVYKVETSRHSSTGILY